MWDVVDDWIKGAEEADRAALREKIRVSTFTRRALRRRKREEARDVDERARAAYEALEPTDLVLRHSWLFKQAWVDESADEISDEEFDYKKREERISQLRQSAIEEVLAQGGISEVFRLADSGQAQHTAGWYPPLWGARSYNWGAGMATIDKAAAFIHANMPQGQEGSLTVQEAWDVATFMDGQIRPQDPRFDGDVQATRANHHDSPFSRYGTIVQGKRLGDPATTPRSGPTD